MSKQETIHIRDENGESITITGEPELIQQYLEDKEFVEQELQNIATEMGKWRRVLWGVGIEWRVTGKNQVLRMLSSQPFQVIAHTLYAQNKLKVFVKKRKETRHANDRRETRKRNLCVQERWSESAVR